LSSGLAHYLLAEGINQASYYFGGANVVDPETKLAVTNLSLGVHLAIGTNMFSNFVLGIGRHFKKKRQRNKNFTLDSVID